MSIFKLKKGERKLVKKKIPVKVEAEAEDVKGKPRPSQDDGCQVLTNFVKSTASWRYPTLPLENLRSKNTKTDFLNVNLSNKY